MKEKLQIVNNSKVKIVIEALLVIYILATLLSDTMLSLRFLGPLQKAAALSGIVLIIIFGLKVLAGGIEGIKSYCKGSIWIILYIIVRLASYLYNGRDYTIARQILFEMVYLLPLCALLIDKTFVKNVVVRVIVFTTLVINLMDFIAVKYLVSCAGKNISNALTEIIINKTYNEHWGVTVMYDNPNFMGMITGLAMILAIELFRGRKTWYKIVLAVLYYAFGFYMVWLSGCRNAQLCLALVLVAIAVEKLIKVIDGKRMAAICLICITLCTGAIYGYVYMNEENYQLTEQEQRINSLSTSRYIIWKSAIYANNDKLAIGSGSITLEKKDRYAYCQQHRIEHELLNRTEETTLGPHNAYIGIILSCGVFAFIFYILHLFRKFRKSSLMNDAPYGMTVLYVLCSNVLECMLITRLNIFCLVMYLVMAPENENEKNLESNNEREVSA